MKSLFISFVALMASLTASAATASGYYKGDINNDGNVDIEDVALLVDVLKGNTSATTPCYLDDDTDVDLEDLQILTDMILQNKKEWVTTDPQVPAGGSNTPEGSPTVAESKGAAPLK